MRVTPALKFNQVNLQVLLYAVTLEAGDEERSLIIWAIIAAQ